MNEKGEPTFYSHSHQTWSTIDLTFINPKAAEHDAAKHWRVDQTKAFGSDHFALRWELDYGKREIENLTGKHFNFKDADPQKWKEAFKKVIESNNADLMPLLDLKATFTVAQLDKATTQVTKAMQETNETTVPTRKPHDRARPWWNKELDKATMRIAEQRSLNLVHQKRWGKQSANVTSLIKKSQNYFKRLYKSAHAQWLTSTLEEATTKDIWSFPKWGKGVRTYPSPAISQGPGREPAVQHSDKCDALRDELFQPPPPLQGAAYPDLTAAMAGDLPDNDVTTDEVHQAIYDQGADKAPGLSQVPFRRIRWAWEVKADLITALMHHCIKIGYHPKEWRKSIAVALAKPRKPDYSNPRAYRLIQLLECLGKVLECIVANRLAYLVTVHNLVPANQFGGRPSSSTDDAILTFVNDVEAAQNHGKVTSALTFDIKGFFDFVNHKRLLTVMREKGIPLQLGSPVSPILSILYAAEILEIFEQKAIVDTQAKASGLKLPDKPTAVHLVMFVDDGKLYVSSDSFLTNTRILGIAYTEVANWLEGIGLAPDMVKRELMHYSKRCRVDGDAPPITLPDAKGEPTIIKAETTTKWLGVHLDRRLTFDFHVKQIAGRAEKTSHLRTLYTACVRPVMTYASAAWWTGKKVHEHWLERVQRRALRLICAAFRTTPIVALELEASILPIRHHLELTSDRAATRFNKLTPFNPILQRLPDTWRSVHTQNRIPGPPLPTHWKVTARRKSPPKSTRLTRLALRSDPLAERILPLCLPPWKKTMQEYQGRLVITPAQKGTAKDEAMTAHNNNINGSMLETAGRRRVGAGYVGLINMKTTIHRKIGMGKKAEVYDAELAGLAWAARDATHYIHTTNHAVQHLHFYADNTSAISTIFEPKTGPGQGHGRIFRQTITEFLDANPENTVEIAWSPGHKGIIGNERADKLAKQATKIVDGTFTTTRAHALRRANEKAFERWTAEWKKTAPTGRFASANRLPPQTHPRKPFTDLPREVFGRLVQCRTGHAFLGEYYAQFVPSETVDCPCGAHFQTRKHILQDCPRYNNYRHILREASKTIDIPTILGTTAGIAALGCFLQESGALTKTGVKRKEAKIAQWEDEEEPAQDEWNESASERESNSDDDVDEA
ncbi:hypothetical protein SCP_1201710 [Sparassis crispa]|uniref:Reverse transcriptase domain-containing protein n=1 Tax=Sparassis crispa TaxID=139825 RepID=A0A401H0J1_9APHY|nr:hypothetical protein SCP_1201710 [Sparassis crispa]GBE87945.1 hypothetical protein SCP_1201710 [Sparassis crispa]